MDNKLDGLLRKLKLLEDELRIEIGTKAKQFRYEIRKKKVHFTAEATASHKKLVKKIRHYLAEASWSSFLTFPMIVSCILPVSVLDVWATLYQFVCFPAYRIPKVRRSDFVVMDRRKLAYLNLFEKLNCVYCEYVNGVIAYVQEIAGRTEQYWCPIKHAMRLKVMHSRYSHFLDYGDGEEYRKRIEQVRRDFADVNSKRDA